MSIEARKLCSQIMKTCNEEITSKSSFSKNQEDEKTIPVTVDFGCFTVTDTKSNGSQTAWNKKSSNKTTTTEVVQVMPDVESNVRGGNKTHVCDIHTVIKVNVVTPKNYEDHESMPRSLESFEARQVLETSKTNKVKRSNKCTCTLDEYGKTGACADSCTHSCKYGGFGPCNKFSLGTADFRQLQREKCNTMLIGGCRVAVCRTNRF